MAPAKAGLDELHNRKIDLADYVLVVSDETGYFGASTRGEIEYALANGKPVAYAARGCRTACLAGGDPMRPPTRPYTTVPGPAVRRADRPAARRVQRPEGQAQPAADLPVPLGTQGAGHQAPAPQAGAVPPRRDPGPDRLVARRQPEPERAFGAHPPRRLPVQDR